jgi:hypothetical protein
MAHLLTRKKGKTMKLTKPILELECYVTGYAHHDAAKVLGYLKPGQTVLLKRDPNNEYDQDAIEVWWKRNRRTKPVQIGFIPAIDGTNIPLAQLMDAGRNPDAIVVNVDPTLRAKNKRITIKVVVR